MSPLLDSNLLQGTAPYTLAGYRLFREIVETDSALPASIKALFVAVAAINKGQSELSRRELERAKILGISLTEATSGMILLSSLRGEGISLAFGEILSATYEETPTTPPVGAAEIRANTGEAEQNFLEYFGTIPPALDNLLKLVPKGADAYYLMRKGSIYCNSLSKKYAELLFVTVLAADYSPMVQRHINGARTADASEVEIAEAILCAIPSAGVAAWMSAGAFLNEAQPS